MELHDDNVRDWTYHSGRSMTSSRSKTMLSNFGLEIFTTTKQAQTGKPDQNKTKGIYNSITSYLIFPCSRFREEATRAEGDQLDWEDGPQFPAAVAGFEVGMAPPKQLSAKDIARFSRACRILDIARISPMTASSTMIAAALGDHATEMDKEGGSTCQEAKTTCVPRLRLLLHTEVHSEGLYY